MNAPLSTQENRPFPRLASDDPLEQLAQADSPEPVNWGKGVIASLESQIERYPWPVLLLAMGVGYLLARRVR